MEQRQAAQPAGEDARPLLVEEHSAERRFGAMLEKDVLFLIAEVGHQLLKLIVGRRSQVEGGFDRVGHIVPPPDLVRQALASTMSPRFWSEPGTGSAASLPIFTTRFLLVDVDDARLQRARLGVVEHAHSS